jgi:hypothetical protein
MNRYLLLISLTATISLFFITLSHSRITKLAPANASAPREIFEQEQEGTPVPDSGYEGDGTDSPSLFDFFRRFVITETPTPSPGAVTPTLTPTRTPRPTATPIIPPPPSNPDYLRLMIALGIIMVIVLLLGIWINRKHSS